MDVKYYFGRIRSVRITPIMTSAEEVFYSIKTPKIFLSQITTMHCISKTLQKDNEAIKKLKSFIKDNIFIWPISFIDASHSKEFVW